MNNITIQGQDFPPGSSGMVRINAGRLPSGNRISIFTYIFRSKNPGPTALILGGMHGDEINGVEIVSRTISDNFFGNLTSGSVIVIPLLNIFGFINYSRDVPDGKDVNRSFPGNMNGSLASRVARMITKKILPLIDFGIDFHTGAKDHWNYPQIRYSPKFLPSKELALKCKYELLVEKSVLSKSFRKIAKDYKKPIIIFEGGEALRLDPFVIDKGLKIIKNLLSSYSMISNVPIQAQKCKIYQKTVWQRAPDSGICSYHRISGEYVKKGELLALIHDPFAQREIKMLATRDAFILGHNNASVVNSGDGMFHLAYEEEIIQYA